MIDNAKFLGCALATLVLAVCSCMVGCQSNDADGFTTDVDAKTVIGDISVNDVNDKEKSGTVDAIELQSGFSKVVAVDIPDIYSDSTITVSTSNPLAVSAELLKEINGRALIEITGREPGGSSVAAAALTNGEEVAFETVSVVVPHTVVYGAEFGIARDGILELTLGETLADKITAYASGHLSSEDITLTSSEPAVVSPELSGISFGDYYTAFGYTVSALSVGNATLCADFSDGTQVLLEVSVKETASAPTDAAVGGISQGISDSDGAVSGEEAALTYVLNTSSRKFHYPECRGVRDMKEENKGSFYGSRDEIIAMDYSPCGTCKP